MWFLVIWHVAPFYVSFFVWWWLSVVCSFSFPFLFFILHSFLFFCYFAHRDLLSFPPRLSSYLAHPTVYFCFYVRYSTHFHFGVSLTVVIFICSHLVSLSDPSLLLQVISTISHIDCLPFFHFANSLFVVFFVHNPYTAEFSSPPLRAFPPFLLRFSSIL